MLRAVAMFVAGLAVISAFPAQAEEYPARPVKLIVPFAAGGPADIYARFLAQRLEVAFAQTFIVDDRPGAGSVIGTDAAAKSAPDGYTLLVMSNTHTVNETLVPNKPYALLRDFVPIAPVNYSDLVMVVHPSVEATNLTEFIALAKGRPGELMFGSAGNGTPGHLNGELFRRLTSIDVIHVPYRVGSQAVTDLIAGRISFWISPIATVLPQIQAGQLRALAVSGRMRSRELPDVPTVRESGFGDYDVSTSYALFAPAGTPQPILGKLQAEVRRALENDGVHRRLRIAGVEPGVGPPEEVQRLLAARIAQWSDVIKISGIRIDER